MSKENTKADIRQLRSSVAQTLFNNSLSQKPLIKNSMQRLAYTVAPGLTHRQRIREMVPSPLRVAQIGMFVGVTWSIVTGFEACAQENQLDSSAFMQLLKDQAQSQGSDQTIWIEGLRKDPFTHGNPLPEHVLDNGKSKTYYLTKYEANKAWVTINGITYVTTNLELADFSGYIGDNNAPPGQTAEHSIYGQNFLGSEFFPDQSGVRVWPQNKSFEVTLHIVQKFGSGRDNPTGAIVGIPILDQPSQPPATPASNNK